MANICCTDIKIVASEEGVKKLVNFLNETVAKNNGSVGCVIDKLGLNREDFCLRSGVETWDYDLEALYLYDEDAWSPHLGWVYAMCDSVLGEDSYTLLYKAEEPGNVLYYTNDDSYEDCVYIDFFDVPTDIEKFADHDCFMNVDVVKKDMEDLLGHTGTFEELTGEIRDRVKSECDGYISFNVYEYVDGRDLN